MKFNSKKLDLPTISKISFFKLFELLEKVSKSANGYESIYAKGLLEKLNQHPELKEGTVDFTILERNKEFVDELMTLLFPSVLTLNEIKGATAPFQFDFFYTSKRLENILAAAGDDFEIEMKSIDEKSMFIMACATILQGHYHYPVHLNIPMIFDIPEKNGNLKYYRSAFNADLLEMTATDKAIDITQEIYWELMDNYDDIAVWKKYFPIGSYEIRGLGIVNLLDISVDQSINEMTSNLLEGANSSIEKVMDNIKSLLNLREIQVSLVNIEKGTFQAIQKYDSGSILMKGIDKMESNGSMCDHGSHLIFDQHKPFIISDAEHYYNNSDNFLAKQLAKSEIKSYILSPLIHDGKFLAFIEVGSKVKRELNSVVHEKLNLTLPILAMAASRFKEEFRIRIDAIIQEECTSIHPAVKWKFENAARELFLATEAGESAQFSDIVFNEVYPLYGQLDVKGSSTKRNDAVLGDLRNQLSEVSEILQIALEHEPLPAYEELLFRIERFLKEFELGLFEGSEQRVLSFLQKEIYPTFDYLSESVTSLAKNIKAYKARINKNTGMIYEQRKAFDDSIGIINNHLAEYIDQSQVKAQKLFPHYFERYKTDGVEFNLYIGDSIAENKKFNPIYLNNLLLWQLETMCKMEREVHTLNDELPMPLEVASLILLFSNSLSIKFRLDEKHFDVDGAYNARYEIIKKRIDKAHIKNTNERITVPGKIAIIYTSKEDANNYKKHIDYMEAKGYLIADSTEDHELEDLQGISGLRALRVSLNFDFEKINSKVETEKEASNLND